MEKNVIDRFLEELEAYIDLLERDYNERKKLFDVDQFLRRNFTTSDTDVYASLVRFAKASCVKKGINVNETKIFEHAAEEVFDVLKFFEPRTNISLDDLKEAFFTCFLAEKNEVMKKFDRYSSAVKLLTTVKQIFVRHQFRRSENNRLSIEQAEINLKKYRNLFNFLMTGELDQELDEISSYTLRAAGFNDEQWLEIYNYILMSQLKSYMMSEDQLREQVKMEVEQELEDKAKELEDKILESLSKESADIIRPNVEVEEEVDSLVPEEDLAYISDGILLEQFNLLTDKVHIHRGLARITPTKEQSFSLVFESLGSIYTLESVQSIYQPSDYLRFLYYAFVREYESIKSDIETEYPVEDIQEYTELLNDEIKKPYYYLGELEKLLQEEKEEQDKLNSEEEIVSEEGTYKLIFLEENGSPDVYRDIKRFTPEKMQDLANVLTKMEEGRTEGSIPVAKSVPVLFRSMRGKLVFVLFRVLSSGHLLICRVNNLDEFDSTIDRLTYDTQYEAELNSIIKDKGIKYAQLMERQKNIRNNVISQGVYKGV